MIKWLYDPPNHSYELKKKHPTLKDCTCIITY